MAAVNNFVLAVIGHRVPARTAVAFGRIGLGVRVKTVAFGPVGLAKAVVAFGQNALVGQVKTAAAFDPVDLEKVVVVFGRIGLDVLVKTAVVSGPIVPEGLETTIALEGPAIAFPIVGRTVLGKVAAAPNGIATIGRIIGPIEFQIEIAGTIGVIEIVIGSEIVGTTTGTITTGTTTAGGTITTFTIRIRQRSISGDGRPGRA